ncbi:MAG: hypothetical protein ACFFCW_14930 [Candidatus Hodarchaeota archaeon]
MSLEKILLYNQNQFFQVERNDNSYMTPGNQFDINLLGSGGGTVYKVFPEAGKADHGLLGFSGHKDVIERTPTGETFKFRIHYEK